VFRFRSASRTSLDLALDRARAAEPTYEAVGATEGITLPNGFRHDRHDLRLGDSSAFDRAKEGLSRWQAHMGAGARVYPDDRIEAGGTVLVLLALGPVQIIAPCRIVYVVDEPGRFGFGYGTLPGHPERGEESFVVEQDGDATVFRITAFSRSADIVTRIGAPVARRLQLRFTGRYLQALARYVAEDART
jgi:uncharacterized protein (UPF0548 family)